MRNLIDIITEAQSSFILHPDLDPSLYSITPKFGGYKRWTAYTFAGDSQYEQGVIAPVGYVLINTKNNTIIPVSRGDEHHRGTDLLYDLISGVRYQGPDGKKKKLTLNANLNDFYPVWMAGTDYVYSERDINNARPALAKFLSYGGVDGIMIGAGEMNGRIASFSAVAKTGALHARNPNPGQIAPEGEKILAQFTALQKAILALGDAPDRPQSTPVFNRAIAFLESLIPMGYHLGLTTKAVTDITTALKTARRNNDVQALLVAIFGFHGLKNIIHAELKETHESNSDFMKEKATAIWGDLDLAIDMLARY